MKPEVAGREGEYGGDAAHFARWALLVVGIFLIVFLRSPHVLLTPSLEAEDGTFIFQHYYHHRDVSEIFRFMAGYITLVPNLIGYISVRLPTRAIPYGFAWIPLGLTLVAYSWLYSRRYREWIGSDATRAVLCILFVLAPLAQWHILANTVYSIWNVLLLIFLLAAVPRSPVAWRRAAIWTALNVLVWSQPLAILVMPIVLYRLVREPRDRLFHALTLVNLVVHQVFGIEESGIFAGLTWFESTNKVVATVGWTAAVVAATAFRTAFGAPVYAWAENHFWAPVAIWSLLLIVLSILAARSSHRLRVLLPLLGYTILSLTYVSMLSRASVMVPLNGAPRYVYVQTMAFFVLFVLLADHFLGSSCRRRRAAVFGGLLLWYVLLNAQLGHYFVANGDAVRPLGQPWSPYVQAHPDNGTIVRDFFAELERMEDRHGSREGIHLVARKIYDWPITIDTRNGAQGR